MGVQSVSVLVKDKPIFYAGETVNLLVDVISNETVSLPSITLILRGQTKVHWTEDHSHSSDDGSGSRTETVILTFDDNRSIVELCQEVPIGTLPSGRSNIPCSLKLPFNLVTSFEGPNGYIRYWIDVKVPPEVFSIPIAGVVVRILQNIDTNLPQYFFPVCGSDSKTLCCGCCAQGPLSIDAKTDRAAYCPGEMIMLNADLVNNSSRQVQPFAKLVQKQIFIAKEKSRKEDTKDFPLQPIDPAITNQLMQPLARSSVAWDRLMFLLPPVIPSVSSPLIQIAYYIEVGFVIPRSRDLKVYLPIVIGTIPFSGQSATINNQVTPNSMFQAAPWLGRGGQTKGPPPTAAPFELPPENNNFAPFTGQMPQCFGGAVATAATLR